MATVLQCPFICSINTHEDLYHNVSQENMSTSQRRDWARHDSGYSSHFDTSTIDNADMLWLETLADGAEVANDDILFQSELLSIDDTSEALKIECEVSRPNHDQDPDAPQVGEERSSVCDLSPFSALLDGAFRSIIHELAFTEKHQQEAGIRVQSSAFQHRLSDVSPALWSRGYLPVTSTYSRIVHFTC
jgi:hypothetical protein